MSVWGMYYTYYIPCIPVLSYAIPIYILFKFSDSGERNGGSQNAAIKTKEDGIRNHEQQLDNVKAQVQIQCC